MDLGDFSAPATKRTPKEAAAAYQPVQLHLNQTTAVFDNCEFRRSRSTTGALIFHRVGTAGVKVESCAFEGNDVASNFGTAATGMFFSDVPQGVLVGAAEHTARAHSLFELPSHAHLSFLSTDDDDQTFFRLVQVRCSACTARIPLTVLVRIACLMLCKAPR